MDYVLIEEGFVLNELNLVSSTMTLTEAEKKVNLSHTFYTCAMTEFNSPSK